jgi:hypothetical protein
MLEFVRPDVIKIDGSIVRSRHLSPSQTQTIAAISAYSEYSPTAILAEGIESEDDLEQAMALGATFGQGWLFGRPGPLPEHFPDRSRSSIPISPREHHGHHPTAPSAVLDRFPPRMGRKSLLTSLTRHLEDTAAVIAEPAAILAAFQHFRNFTPAVARRYSSLAATHAFVAALGVNMPAEPATRVRGAPIHENDDLADEWTIAVVGPHYYGALIAHDMGDPPDATDRRYAYAFTHDRAAVVDAARSLMARVHTPGLEVQFDGTRETGSDEPTPPSP